MATLREGELQITLPRGAIGRQFDGPEHGLSHCMKAVDWVIELADHIRFIELKDPDAQRAAAHRDKQNFHSKSLTTDLRTKFRDSFLYEWAGERTAKPILYFVVIASESLDKAELTRRSDDLKRMLPTTGQPPSWHRAIAQDCGVFNVHTWNANFPDWPLVRISEQPNRSIA